RADRDHPAPGDHRPRRGIGAVHIGRSLGPAARRDRHPLRPRPWSPGSGRDGAGTATGRASCLAWLSPPVNGVATPCGRPRAREVSVETTVGEAVARRLVDWGVDTVFGLPGDGI